MWAGCVAIYAFFQQCASKVHHQLQTLLCRARLLATKSDYPRWEDQPGRRCRLPFNDRLVVTFHQGTREVVQAESRA